MSLNYLMQTDRYSENYEKFLMLAEEAIPKTMADWLSDLGYFFQAAAKSHHGAHPYGLVEHSICVAEKLADLTEKNNLQWDRKESPIIVGLLHDICKCDDYIIIPHEYPWEPEETEEIRYNHNQMYPGHGDKSVQMILRYICDNGDFYLTDEEELCIRFHMGAFTEKENWKYYCEAVKYNENVMWTHHADMYASQIEQR